MTNLDIAHTIRNCSILNIKVPHHMVPYEDFEYCLNCGDDAETIAEKSRGHGVTAKKLEEDSK